MLELLLFGPLECDNLSEEYSESELEVSRSLKTEPYSNTSINPVFSLAELEVGFGCVVMSFDVVGCMF